MSAVREAVLFPLLFLAVVAAAAARPGAAVVLQPPSQASLVCAIAWFGLLVRSGVLAPERLVNPSRSWLANANGVTVLVSVFFASAQLITLVMPATGLPALLGWVLLVSLLLQAFAVEPDRIHLLRGLLVTFAAAFTIKFVVLAALATPIESRVGRVLRSLFDGLTLGSLSQPPLHASEGYIAFAAIVVYLIGLSLLPSAGWRTVRVAVRQLEQQAAEKGRSLKAEGRMQKAETRNRRQI